MPTCLRGHGQRQDPLNSIPYKDHRVRLPPQPLTDLPSMPLKLRGSLPKSLPGRRDPSTKPSSACPSCANTQHHRNFSTRRSNHALFPSRVRTQVQSYPQTYSQLRTSEPRNASRYSTAPSTTLTARHVPPRLRELYESLAHLQRVAPDQVNLSRLQLALRGLESEEPLIRIAGGWSNSSSTRQLEHTG